MWKRKGRRYDWRLAKRRSRKLIRARVKQRGGGRKGMEIAMRKLLVGLPW
jgi:hypothetical protein